MSSNSSCNCVSFLLSRGMNGARRRSDALLVSIFFLFSFLSFAKRTQKQNPMFFSAPTAAAPPAIQHLPPALATATSSSAAVPSLEAALSAATTAAASNKISVSFFNEGTYSSFSSFSSLPAASYSGFEVDDSGHGYDEAFLRGIAAASGEQQQLPRSQQQRKLRLHPLSSLASSASPSFPIFFSITSRPRGGFETRVAEYCGGKLARIRLQPPPGRARPGARVRVSPLSPSSLPSSSASVPTTTASASSSSSSSSLVDVVLAFALAREEITFTAVNVLTRSVLLESGGAGGNRDDDGAGDERDGTSPLVFHALGGGSPAYSSSLPSSSSSLPSSSFAGVSSSSSVTARLWALVPPEGEIAPNGRSSRLRRRFVSVDGCPLEAPSLEAELDHLFAGIRAGLCKERRRGGGRESGIGRSGSGGQEEGAGAAALAAAHCVPAFVLKLSTAAAKGNSSCGDTAPFCGRGGLPCFFPWVLRHLQRDSWKRRLGAA